MTTQIYMPKSRSAWVTLQPYKLAVHLKKHWKLGTVMTLSFRTDRSGQTVQTQIRLLLEEQSDQGLQCLLFQLHLFSRIP